MATFRLCVAWREDNGVVRPPVTDEPIEAPNQRDAVAVALTRLSGLLGARTNLAWLVGPDGTLAWTLRMDRSTQVVI